MSRGHHHSHPPTEHFIASAHFPGILLQGHGFVIVAVDREQGDAGALARAAGAGRSGCAW
ncbi:MAG: hypothetical protein R3F31_01600 [Verrucomicrobiales bacterium]